MRHILNQLLIIVAPLALFACWICGPVQGTLAEGDALHAILLMLGGLAVFVFVETLLFKYHFLPLWARMVSERLYGGSYFPQEDPLMCLVHQITTEHRLDLIPELTRAVEGDPRRVSAWLELARVLHDHALDAPQAVQCLLRGAKAVRSKEDKALLLWRAAVMCEKHSELAEQSRSIYQKIVDSYPNTSYGKLAAKLHP